MFSDCFQAMSLFWYTYLFWTQKLQLLGWTIEPFNSAYTSKKENHGRKMKKNQDEDTKERTHTEEERACHT